MMYIAFYKGKKQGRSPKILLLRLLDWTTRKLTRGQYSHCEIALPHPHSSTLFNCYSASLRDGGVRVKTMPLPPDKWDLIPLPDNERLHLNLREHFAATQGCRYDYLGALGIVSFTKQNPKRWFCSEWCGAVLGLRESWRFSPNDLAGGMKHCR